VLIGSPIGLKVKGKLSELLMLQFTNELEHFLRQENEKEGRKLIEIAKKKVYNTKLFNELLDNIIHSQYKDKRVGFLELIENSLDSMHFDGGDLVMKINQNGNQYEFSVTDMGHGMTTKDLMSFLILPFKSTRKESKKSPYYGGTGVGFQTALNLSDNIRVITSSGDGINELELVKKEDDWVYTLITREGKVTGTTIIGKFDYEFIGDLKAYIKKYYYFVNPDKSRIMVNDEKINTGKTDFKGNTFKYSIQKENIKSNIFLYHIRDGKRSFRLYRKGRFVKNYLDELTNYSMIYSFIRALMNEADYSFAIEMPDFIELTGTKDEIFIDDKSNLENTIKKMLESFILSEIVTSEPIMKKIQDDMGFIYEILFKEIVSRDKYNNRNFEHYNNRDNNFSFYLFRKLSQTKFINVLQMSSSTYPRKVKISPEELYDNIKKGKINYIKKMASLKSGMFVEEGNPALKSLLNIDSSYYNLIKTSRKDEYDNQARQRNYEHHYKVKNQPKISVIEKTPLETLERVLNIEKKAGEFVVLLRLFEHLDKLVSKIIGIPESNINIHSNLTVDNDEIALTDDKTISLNISNKTISGICDNLLKKKMTANDMVKIMDIFIHEKSHITDNHFPKGEFHSFAFYENVKASMRNKFIRYLYENDINLDKDLNKIIKSRPYSDKIKTKDMMKLIKKHSINEYNLSDYDNSYNNNFNSNFNQNNFKKKFSEKDFHRKFVNNDFKERFNDEDFNK
jgi:hypothetical protein